MSEARRRRLRGHRRGRGTWRRDRARLRPRRARCLRDAAAAPHARSWRRWRSASAPTAAKRTPSARRRATKPTSPRSSKTVERILRPDRSPRLQYRRQCSVLRRSRRRRQVYSKVWEMACLAGFLTSREAARASWRRGAGARSSSPARLRACAAAPAFRPSPAPSTACGRWRRVSARELGPKGVHVAHVVIDGAIDGEFIRGLMPDAAEKLEREEILVPDEIARNYVWLYRQKRSAWTFEMDLRPWAETW